MGSQSTLSQHLLRYGGNARLVHSSCGLNVSRLHCLCEEDGYVFWDHFMSDEASTLFIKQKEKNRRISSQDKKDYL